MIHKISIRLKYNLLQILFIFWILYDRIFLLTHEYEYNSKCQIWSILFYRFWPVSDILIFFYLFFFQINFTFVSKIPNKNFTFNLSYIFLESSISQRNETTHLNTKYVSLIRMEEPNRRVKF